MSGKLPRIDLRKLTDGSVASRREAVTELGDALREQGGVRVEGHGAEPQDVAVLAAVADHVLEGLAEYFGLPSRVFVDAAGPTASAAGRVAVMAVVPRALLVLLPAVPADAQVRGPGERWTSVAARAGELTVVPGGALARLTGDVVPAGALRWSGAEAVRAVLVSAASAELEPLRDFAAEGGAASGGAQRK